MKIIVILITALSFFAQAESLVFHEIRNDETLWFLAEVYYGNGKLYPKIADANMLDESSKLFKGRRLLIPEPVFSPDSSDFEQRFAMLQRRRAQKLVQKLNRLTTNVVLTAKPARFKKIDKVLDFEKPKVLKTPAQSAEAELQNR